MRWFDSSRQHQLKVVLSSSYPTLSSFLAYELRVRRECLARKDAQTLRKLIALMLAITLENQGSLIKSNPVSDLDRTTFNWIVIYTNRYPIIGEKAAQPCIMPHHYTSQDFKEREGSKDV
jgi:hypothetical protein